MARPDPERLAALRSLRRAHAVVERRLEVALHDEHDLPLTWFETLAALQEAGGKLRIHDLAEVQMIVKSSLSRQVARMEEHALVRRDRSDEDGRGVVVHLTADGRQAWRTALTTYKRIAQQAFCAHVTDSDLPAVARVSTKVLLGE